MEQLIRDMKRALADAFMMYFKAHSFHWNVEGMFFSQYHEFFGDIYEEVYGSIDDIAEEIRKLDAYAPMSLEEMYSNRTVDIDQLPGEGTPTSRVVEMLAALDAANVRTLQSLNDAFVSAEQLNEQGLMDFLAGRISCHKKHQWMIRASMRAA